MDFVVWMLGLAWRMLTIAGGFIIFIYVMKNGKGAIKDLLNTITIFMKTLGHWIRKRCFDYLRKEEQEGDKTHVEATVE